MGLGGINQEGYKIIETKESNKYPCYVYKIAKEGEKPDKYIHGIGYVFDRVEKKPEKIKTLWQYWYKDKQEIS